MQKFGLQYLDTKHGMISEKRSLFNECNEQHIEIKKVLQKFQDGYTARNIENVDSFVKELFIEGEETCALGTGTGELFLGSDKVKELIKGDWQYWGDVNIDWTNLHITVSGENAWFATTGSVKYTFEDTPERYDNYVNFIKDKAEESQITAKQKIAFINWVLSLTYHQREDKKREYLWPMGLSGVLLKSNGKWKIAHLQFSLSKGNFPDERFEECKEYVENYHKQSAMADEYRKNAITEEIKVMLKNFQREFFGQKSISKELISKYFNIEKLPYILGTENQWYDGIEQVKGFFGGNSNMKLSLDLEHAIAQKSGEITWITVTGILKQQLTEEQLAQNTLEELANIFNGGLNSEEKLFAAHRSVSWVLKEGAVGDNYTCPIRLTAVILNSNTGLAFEHIHFSFPSYWIFEGKLGSNIVKWNI